MTAYPPSPIRVRPHQLCRALTALGHEVVIGCPVSGDEERAAAAALAAEGFRVVTCPLSLGRKAVNLLRAAATGEPLQSRIAWSPGLVRMLDDELGKSGPFDVIHVEHLRGSHYALALTTLRAAPVVWDSVDCITELFQQARTGGSARGKILAALDLARTRRFEARLVRAFPAVVVSSRHDAKALAALSGLRPEEIAAIPNGVDLEHFAPPGTAARLPAAADVRISPNLAPITRDPATLVFTGKMSYHANAVAAEWLVRDIMPLVWREVPDACVVLAGAYPGRALRALAIDERVTVTGFVSDLRPYIARATVAIAPMRYGVGIQNKVLEAMAMATPVVATPVVSRALDAGDGDLVVAETVEALAEAVVGLIREPDRAAAMGRRGRAYVERAHRWSEAAAALEAVYQVAIDRAGENQTSRPALKRDAGGPASTAQVKLDPDRRDGTVLTLWVLGR